MHPVTPAVNRHRRQARIARFAELALERGGYDPADTPYYLERLGITSPKTLRSYLKEIENSRTICSLCRQLMPPGAEGRYQQTPNGKADGRYRYHVREPKPVNPAKLCRRRPSLIRLSELIAERGGYNPDHRQWYMEQLGINEERFYHDLRRLSESAYMCTGCGQFDPRKYVRLLPQEEEDEPPDPEAVRAIAAAVAASRGRNRKQRQHRKPPPRRRP